MKILITGKNGYIARNLFDYLKRYTNYEVSLHSLRSHDYDLSKVLQGYDILIHLSGLVHKKEKEILLEDYIKTNVNLTLRLAKESHKSSIKHFIFVSSMSVFGEVNLINNYTIPNPVTKYGISKLMAENELLNFSSLTNMKISIIRPPVVIGFDAPGNPNLLFKFSKFLKFVPKIINKRSVIFIDRLSLHILQVIRLSHKTITHPQMRKNYSTNRLISYYRSMYGLKTYESSFLNPLFYLFSFIPFIKMIYKNNYHELSYDSTFEYDSCLYDE